MWMLAAWVQSGFAWAQDADGDSLLDTDEDINSSGSLADDDTDADGTPDYLDADDDGDTLLTDQETLFVDQGFGSDDPRDYDFDADGTQNYLDADDDNDLIGTICEITFGVDHLQPDMDGDTFLDGEEWYNFIYIEGLDVPDVDVVDDNGALTGLDCFSPWDRDSDGFINALDSDDDNDGLSTGTDEFNVDSDCLIGTSTPAGDGIPAYVDRDSDNDGIPDDASGTVGEGFGDSDGDNIFDFLDCDNSNNNGDSDADGILNGDEDNFLCAGLSPSVPCSLDPDVDKDGVIDGVEVGASIEAPQDSDGDAQPDMWDRDDDNDLRSSALENGIVGCLDADGDGAPDLRAIPVLAGANFSHWAFRCPDAAAPSQDLDFDFGGNDLSDYPDLDFDTVPDFLDTDDDGDGVPSIEEGMGDIDGDGDADAIDADDTDGPDADPDGDDIRSVDEESVGTDPNSADSDGDGIDDGIEIGLLDSPLDSDGDGLIDALDPDDDNDRIPTLIEGLSDPDADTLPSYLDLDSDGDGALDESEGTIDADGDGIPAYIDTDEPLIGTPDDDTDVIKPPEPPVGCGCDTNGVSPAPWLLAFAVLGLRRRGC